MWYPRHVRRAFLVAVAAGLLAACRLFVDLDGLQGGAPADAGSSQDGTTPPAPPTPPPSPQPDASSDAGPDADAAPFCSTVDASVFCDSFDLGDTTFSAWTSADKTNGGMLQLATTDPKSPPGFLRASLAGGTAGSQATAALNKTLGVRTTITWAADVRVITAPITASHELLEMYDDTTNSVWAFFFDLDPGGLSMDEEYAGSDGGTQSKYTAIPGTLGTGTWHRVAISANFTSKNFSVSLDGVVVASGTFANAPATPNLRASAGISWTATPSTGGVIDMDNVTGGD